MDFRINKILMFMFSLNLSWVYQARGKHTESLDDLGSIVGRSELKFDTLYSGKQPL